jgi:hypothetical protein
MQRDSSAMAQRLLIALGAGLAAAVLFIIPMKGTMAAMAIAFLAPLPIMIVALGFGHLTGLGAGLLGALLIVLFLHPLYGLTFAATLALPCWWLSWLALRSRPAADSVKSSIYYPLGYLLSWIAGIAAVTAVALIGVIGATFGSYEAAVQRLSDRLAPMLLETFGDGGSLPGGLTAQNFAALVILAMPPVMAAWGVVTFSVNLWLAGRIVMISERLPRPWTDVPANLRLPRLGIAVLGVALAFCVLPGLGRIIAASVATAIGIAFALQGLAAIHAATRGGKARAPVLGGIYALIFALMPWPLFLAALVGIADTVSPFRGRSPPAPPSVP